MILLPTLLLLSSPTLQSNHHIKFTNSTNSNSPIILIPGILGSVLEAKLSQADSQYWICWKNSDWFKIWIDAKVILPPLDTCWVDNMSLVHDNITKKMVNKKGLKLRAKNWGIPTGSVDYLDPGSSKWNSIGNYFATMRDYFVKEHAYVEGKNLFAAPYDWRLTPANNKSKYCYDLKELIETAVKKNGYNRVVILAHSMGNLFFYYCTKKIYTNSWTNKYIGNYINIAGPMAGAPKTIKSITSGENDNIGIIRPNTLRRAEASWPSTWFLLPNPSALGTFSDNKNLVQIQNYKNLTINEYPDLFKLLKNNNEIFDIYKHAENIYNEYSGESLMGQLEPLDIPTLCIIGDNIATANSYIWKDLKSFPDYTPDTQTAPGDGVIPKWTIEKICQKWKRHQKHKVEFNYQNETHMGLMQSKISMEIISKFIGLDVEDEKL